MVNSFENLHSMISDEHTSLADKVEAILKMSTNTDPESRDFLETLRQHEDERIQFFVKKLETKELIWKINLIGEGKENIMAFFYYRDIVEVKNLIDTIETPQKEEFFSTVEDLRKECLNENSVRQGENKTVPIVLLIFCILLFTYALISLYSMVTSRSEKIYGNKDNSYDHLKERSRKVPIKKAPIKKVAINKVPIKKVSIKKAPIKKVSIKKILVKNSPESILPENKKVAIKINKTKDVALKKVDIENPEFYITRENKFETKTEKILYKVTELVNNKKYDDAIIELQRIARVYPYEPAPYLEMGDIFIRRLGQPDNGIKAYEEALKRKPDMNDLRVLLARFYESIEEYKKSIMHYSLLIMYETDLKLKNMFKEKLFELSQKGK